jgi:hypothetical protein
VHGHVITGLRIRTADESPSAERADADECTGHSAAEDDPLSWRRDGDR